MNTVSAAILDAYVGKGMGEICANHFDSPSQNHCAHFVSHALGLQLGLLCGDMEYATRRTGASIRCDEVFNRLASRGPWASAPGVTDGLLCFVTNPGNVTNNVMANVPQKHVGIVWGGAVYNFGNTQHMVRKEPTVEAFRTRLDGVYRGGVSLYFAQPQ